MAIRAVANAGEHGGNRNPAALLTIQPPIAAQLRRRALIAYNWPPRTPMPPAPQPPRAVPQVMVSSTFADLQEHRTALIEAIHGHKLHANVMENDSARLVDVIDSSLQMVRDSAGYIAVIGLKYGQIPEDRERNPDNLSITELEFNEAQRLERPILLFIMGEDHWLKRADIEIDPSKQAKLNAFRDRAKRASPGSSVHRVYAVFNSVEEFTAKLGASLAELSNYLEPAESAPTDESPARAGAASATIPKPPSFYAQRLHRLASIRRTHL